MNYINLTGHEVYNLTSGLRLPPQGCLRGRTRTKRVTIDGQPVKQTQLIELDLPEPQDDTIFIVSALSMNAVPSHRKDVWCPDEVVREKGVVVGCRAFRMKE